MWCHSLWPCHTKLGYKALWKSISLPRFCERKSSRRCKEMVLLNLEPTSADSNRGPSPYQGNALSAERASYRYQGSYPEQSRFPGIERVACAMGVDLQTVQKIVCGFGCHFGCHCSQDRRKLAGMDEN